MQAPRSTLIVCLGGNLPSQVGAPAQTFAAALAKMADYGILPRAISRFYQTPCFPAGAGPDYVNAAVRAETSLDPAAALAALHSLECAYGRTRSTRWGRRTLDLDLIAFDDLILPSPQVQADWMKMDPEKQQIAAPDRLILPHPRLQERAFVLVPICDIAANWRHPVLGQTARALRDALDPADLSLVVPL